MKLIITRPSSDTEPLAAKLEKLGHEAVILPLLDIVPRENQRAPRATYQALCITSANGLLNAVLNAQFGTTPVLCVGPQSAAAAMAAGFTRVAAHGGDVEGLVAHIVKTLTPGSGPLLYLSGATTSGDLEGRLRKAGFDVDRIIIYDAVATEPVGVAASIASADGVLLYSPRSAKLWVALVESSYQQSSVAGLMHYCLSPTIAKALPQSWPRRIAATPDDVAILATLDRPGLEQLGEQE